MKLLTLKKVCQKCDKVCQTEHCTVKISKFVNYKGFLFHVIFTFGFHENYISIADPYFVVYGEEYIEKESYKNIKKALDNWITKEGMYE